MTHARHRRIILIDNRFQLRMAAAFLLVQVLLTGLFAFGLFLFMRSELQAGLASAHAAYRSMDRMLMPLVGVLAAFNVLVSAILVTAFVVLLSHRIAGPLHRFRLVMADLAARRIQPHARIRPADQLGPLSEATSQALDVLQRDLEALQGSAAQLRKAQEAGDAPAAAQALASLEAVLAPWHPAPGRTP